MVNVISRQENAEENHSEKPLHTHDNGYGKKIDNKKCWQGCGEVGTSSIANANVK